MIENTDAEQVERLNARVSELLSEVAKAKGALAYLIDHIEYNDSYGVEGSCFQACHLCRGGGAPGIRLEHEATCPIRRCAEIAQEWWDERQEENAELLRERDGLRNALKPFVEKMQMVENTYRKRGGNPDTFKDDHPSFDVKAHELRIGVWRKARAALAVDAKEDGK